MGERLYRSRSDRMLSGVCGGLANYFGIDPTIVRVIFVLLIFANGLGVLAYIILAVVVPVESSTAAEPKQVIRENVEEMRETADELGQENKSSFARKRSQSEEITAARHRRLSLLGIILVVVGVVFLLGAFNLFWWLHWGNLWPVIIIAVGVLLIVRSLRKR